MAENDSLEGKSLELHMFEQKILEAIEIAKKQKQDTGIIENGQMTFEIRIEKIDKKIKIHAFGEEILTLEEGDKFTYNIDGLKNIQEKLEEDSEFDYSQFGLPDIEYLEEQEKQEEEKQEEQRDEKDLSEDLEEKKEDSKEEPKKGEEDKKKNNDNAKWQEMDLDREFSNSDTLRVWIKDVLGVAPDKVYRKQTGPHDFEYVAEINGKYEPLELSTDQEGKNTMQQVYIVKEDGTLELEEVDSLLLTKDGNYGIATKVPDGIATDVTKSFEVKRTKDGKYVATQLIEKTGPYRDANQAGKEIADRDRSIYDIEEDLDEVENAENSDMEIAEDGVTVEEIAIIQELKKEGYEDKEIDNIIKRMQENDMSLEDSKKIEDRNREEDNQKTPWGDAESRRSRW